MKNPNSLGSGDSPINPNALQIKNESHESETRGEESLSFEEGCKKVLDSVNELYEFDFDRVFADSDAMSPTPVIRIAGAEAFLSALRDDVEHYKPDLKPRISKKMQKLRKAMEIHQSLRGKRQYTEDEQKNYDSQVIDFLEGLEQWDSELLSKIINGYVDVGGAFWELGTDGDSLPTDAWKYLFRTKRVFSDYKKELQLEYRVENDTEYCKSCQKVLDNVRVLTSDDEYHNRKTSHSPIVESDSYDCNPFNDFLFGLQRDIDTYEPGSSESRISKKMQRLKKAMSIHQILREKDTYTEEQDHDYSSQVVDFLKKLESSEKASDRTCFMKLITDMNGNINWSHFDFRECLIESYWDLDVEQDSLSVEAWAFLFSDKKITTADGEYDAPATFGFRFGMAELRNYIKEKKPIIKEARDATVRKQHPEIFETPDINKIELFTKHYAEKLDDNRLKSIKETFIKNPEDGIREAADYLAEVFGIEEPIDVVFVEVVDGNKKTAGLYSHSERRISIKKDKYWYSFGDSMDTIAHEMWHAHQHDIIDKNTEDEYANVEELITNNQHYVQADTDYWGYYNQLFETEARSFGAAFCEKMTEAITPPIIKRAIKVTKRLFG